MRSVRFTIVGIGASGVAGLSSKGLSTIRDADLILYDHELPEELRTYIVGEGRSLKLAQQSTGRRINQTSTLVNELKFVKKGHKLVRLCSDQSWQSHRLANDLHAAKKNGFKIDYVPSRDAFYDLAWDLGLPWLSAQQTEDFDLVQALELSCCSGFWKRLAQGRKTLVVDVAPHQRQQFLDRLLLELKDIDRPAALVDCLPAQHPVCWLTTLSEMDEMLTLWQARGTTVIYIGSWHHGEYQEAMDSHYWSQLRREADSLFLSQLA
jgi:uroporphyrin-III C-methyltransferase/precorrin-2 dehydrogenase/sirohydrochlorin ferrochelatase